GEKLPAPGLGDAQRHAAVTQLLLVIEDEELFRRESLRGDSRRRPAACGAVHRAGGQEQRTERRKEEEDRKTGALHQGKLRTPRRVSPSPNSGRSICPAGSGWAQTLFHPIDRRSTRSAPLSRAHRTT